jgi:hypothetical protein
VVRCELARRRLLGEPRCHEGWGVGKRRWQKALVKGVGDDAASRSTRMEGRRWTPEAQPPPRLPQEEEEQEEEEEEEEEEEAEELQLWACEPPGACALRSSSGLFEYEYFAACVWLGLTCASVAQASRRRGGCCASGMTRSRCWSARGHGCCMPSTRWCRSCCSVVVGGAPARTWATDPVAGDGERDGPPRPTDKSAPRSTDTSAPLRPFPPSGWERVATPRTCAGRFHLGCGPF